MAFRAGDRSLRVSTEEGSVTVAGGCLEAPKIVSAGESLEPCPSRQAPEPDDMPAVEAAPALAPSVAPGARTTATPVRVERWRELLAAGRLREALRAAERANFDQVCRTATAKELMALADAGRFFGPSKRAVSALVALRERFPGSAAAGTAAFTLGRIVFENEHAYAQAATWFETYLREQPSGPLMGDAFGRLMEARLRSGDTTRARASASQYLRRFPGGPYSAEARGILSR
jgi:outer membrane protein assembly factor BamD (BamD/ComL family)